MRRDERRYAPGKVGDALDDDGGRGGAQLYAETKKVEKERDSASGHRGITRSNRFVELKIVDETREARPSREA